MIPAEQIRSHLKVIGVERAHSMLTAIADELSECPWYDEYQKWVTSKVKKDFETFREAMACQIIGLAGEVGELADMVKKKYFHGKDMDRDKIVKEFGDILFYLCAASDLMGISFSEIVKANVKKLNERYPNGFDPARAHGIGETPKEDRPIVSTGQMTPSDIASDADVAEAARLHNLEMARDWPESEGEGPDLGSD